MSRSWLSRIIGPPETSTNFADAFESIARLRDLTNELEQMEADIHDRENRLQQILDNIGVSIWAKDVNNRFVYANLTCCDTILHCSKDEVREATDTDFEENALADVCAQSDDITKTKGKTCRFIEHSVYTDYDLWIDSEKSPWFEDGEVVGTVGTGKNITDMVPDEIRNRIREPLLIEIPVDSYLDSERLRELIAAATNN